MKGHNFRIVQVSRAFEDVAGKWYVVEAGGHFCSPNFATEIEARDYLEYLQAVKQLEEQ